MPAKIGIGFVGLSANETGWAARSHYPALKLVPDFEIRAITTSSERSARDAAEKYGVPAYAHAADMASRPDVDLVVVAVKVSDHRAAAEAALNAGKMVYCEWPLANGLAEAEAMAALARAKGLRNFVGLQGHSAPPVRYVRDLVASGYVGEVVSTSVIGSSGSNGPTAEPRMVYTLDRANGATMMTIRFSHTVDGLCWCLGEFRDLTATLAVRYPMVKRTDTGEMLPKTAEDQIAVNGTLANGAVASVHFRGGLSRGTNLLWEINGTKGDILVTGALGALQYGHVRVQGGNGEGRELADLPVPAKYQAVEGTPADSFYTMAQAYGRLADDIRKDSGELPSFADGLLRHRMIDAIERANATGARQSYDLRVG